MRLFFLSVFLYIFFIFFFFNDTATTEIYTLSLHDALPIYFFFLAPFFTACCSQAGLRFSRNARTPSLPSADARAVAIRVAMSSINSGSIRRLATVWIRSLVRSEEHTSELQSLRHLVCRLLL